MKTKTAIEHFGTQVSLAKALGITKGAIQFWGEYVPEGRAYQIQHITKGKLKVESKPLKKAS